MTKILSFKKKNKNGGGQPPREPPTGEEIRNTLRAVEATLRAANEVLGAMEKRQSELEDRLDLHSKYILTIVQALLRAGVEVPLTTKRDKD